jgi:hypothetical protein
MVPKLRCGPSREPRHSAAARRLGNRHPAEAVPAPRASPARGEAVVSRTQTLPPISPQQHLNALRHVRDERREDVGWRAVPEDLGRRTHVLGDDAGRRSHAVAEESARRASAHGEDAARRVATSGMAEDVHRRAPGLGDEAARRVATSGGLDEGHRRTSGLGLFADESAASVRRT